MYIYIILCLSVSFRSVLSDVFKREGAACEWDGVKGRCVKETRCLTTLNRQGDPHPVCSKQGDVTIVCCTDCELVNSTSNAVTSFGFYWKDGTKARDHCLQYLDELPYRCREGGYSSGISRVYDEEKECHTIGLWSLGGAVPSWSETSKFPHQALLGFGDYLESAIWALGGTIISDKFILTIANIHKNGKLNFVRLGFKKYFDNPRAWQTHKIKRFIRHPDYKRPSLYHNIALIETDTQILFNENILPACLHVEAANDEIAVTTTLDNLDFINHGHTILTETLDKISAEDCQAAYAAHPALLKYGIDFKTQMCYGNKSNNKTRACQCQDGQPLLVDTQFSPCIHTIIGLMSFREVCQPDYCKPEVLTKVAYYKPWIESVVWP